ncbi:MAG TPA: aminotransferase class I/II-fold pyridoxal phosphate-dependent enzyme [Solirubrobacteraceae bacterium]|jgi:aspartate/methionine/tyrosine aminotransferase|nr:aminotransferase class I/II-fold pyridoxal phosphate-dependent enzyme [Solirubrobacteraceae bacterium]
MEINPFAIERYYERWEFRAELMLSSSDCESMELGELLALEPDARQRMERMHLGYTEVPGSTESREAISSLYTGAAPEDVLTLAAAEEGIFLAYHALIGPGDHAIVEAPCYGSGLEVARSTGADVSLWQRSWEQGWRHDVERLEALLRPETRFIYINSPHNPTGTQMDAAVFDRVVELAREREIVLFGDEVYRGLEHDPAAMLPTVSDAYERGISLGTVSKAQGLPGLRIGWLTCRDGELLARVRDLKLYTTICSSAPSELLVALALRHNDALVERSRRLVLSNLPLIADFLSRRSEQFEWIPPTAGPIGFPRVRLDGDVQEWCEAIATDADVLLLPGSVYEQPEHVRIGFGRANLPEALERLDNYLG